ncbi:conserved hypothetical protein [Mesorhizobium metallidurans STM 2683]|uniref:Uncharacterized protein n=1 Tax=Mesorhizobium metallidurans STM 2683 TaxID=1297569 RepID=M5EPT0_9HYPH|nr:conserved hypothetical protein [Mesorhizobium metallidurans STM 2683]
MMRWVKSVAPKFPSLSKTGDGRKQGRSDDRPMATSPPGTPRPVNSADGRSPGSRVSASSCLPSLAGQWHFRMSLAAYSCGGSHGLDPKADLTVFPFHPSPFDSGTIILSA